MPTGEFLFFTNLRIGPDCRFVKNPDTFSAQGAIRNNREQKEREDRQLQIDRTLCRTVKILDGVGVIGQYFSRLIGHFLCASISE